MVFSSDFDDLEEVWIGLRHTHTLMDMRTDSTAVPHAGLSENLRNQDRCQ